MYLWRRRLLSQSCSSLIPEPSGSLRTISSTLPAATSEDEEEEEWNVTPTPAFCAPPFTSQISAILRATFDKNLARRTEFGESTQCTIYVQYIPWEKLRVSEREGI